MFKDLSTDFLIGCSETYPYVTVFSEEEILKGKWEILKKKKDENFWKSAFLIEENEMDLNKRKFCNFLLLNESCIECLNREYKANDLDYAKVYLNMGEGYQEKDSLITKLVRTGSRYRFELNLPFGVNGVRIDPIEYRIIEVGGYTVKINGNDTKISIPKFQKLFPHRYKKIQTRDPYFLVDIVTESFTSIIFEADIRIVE